MRAELRGALRGELRGALGDELAADVDVERVPGGLLLELGHPAQPLRHRLDVLPRLAERRALFVLLEELLVLGVDRRQQLGDVHVAELHPQRVGVVEQHL